MYKQQKYIEKPLHLVEVNAKGHLFLNYETVDIINNVKSPLGILSIAGPYRTGKSFLLNSLISKSGAFQVGNTTKSTTKGLWIWGKPILGNDTNSKLTNVLIIDSQGFGNFEDTHDKRITTLALLLSTCFLYNSRGPIDKDSIFDLQYIIDIARSICVTENVIHRTDFHWILRDFHLELVNEMGNPITPNQYLQNSLYQSQQNVSRSTIQTLKSYFPNRSCHCLVKPNLTAEERPQFVEQVIQLRKIMSSIRSIEIDGSTLIAILQTYIHAINSGQSLPKVFQEGYECRVRLTCLQKLQNQLRQLEQIATNGQDVDLKIKQLRKDLHTYSKQRMCSQIQLQTLQVDINQMISEFYEIVKPRNTPILKISQKTDKNPKLQFNKRNYKYALKIKQLEQQVNNAKTIKDNQIKVQKLQTIRVREQYQAKILRYQLQITSIKKQVDFYKEEYQKLLKYKEDGQKQIANIQNQLIQKQKIKNTTINTLQLQIQQLKKKYIIANSQINKLKVLNSQKIQFLQKTIKQHQDNYAKVQEQLENKYKDRIKELLNQIYYINQNHQQQISKVKSIYKIQTETLIKNQFQDQPQNNNDFIEQFKNNIKKINQLNQTLQSLKLYSVELQNKIKQQNQKRIQLQKSAKQNIEIANKRAKQNSSYLITIYQKKLQNKQQIILQLKEKINYLNKSIDQNNDFKLDDSSVEKKTNLQEISYFQTQIIKLKNKNSHLNLEINKLHQQIEEKQIKFVKQKQKQNYLQETILDLQEKIDQYQYKCKQYEIDIIKIKNSFEIQKLQMYNQIKQLENKLEESNYFHSQELKNINDLKSLEISRYQQRYNQLNNTIQQIDKLRQIEQKYQKLQVINSNLQAQLQQVNKSSRMTIQKFDIKIQELIQQNFKLQKDKQILNDRLQEYKKTMQENQKKIEQIQNKNYSNLESKFQILLNNFHQNQKSSYIIKEQNINLKGNLTKIQNQYKSNLNQIYVKHNLQIQKLIQQSKHYKQFYQNLTIKQRQVSHQLQILSKKNQQIISSLAKQEIQNNNLIQLERQNFQQQINKFSEKLKQERLLNKKLQNLLDIHQKDKFILKKNIIQYQKININQSISYKNHLRLYEKQVKELKQKCQKNIILTQQWKQKYQQCLETKNFINSNYQKDFQLWKNKFTILQCKLKESKFNGIIKIQ